jgi:uncharacterized membrane protein YhaH (DUF805 family)
MPFRRYADFSGRSGRQEFWMFQMFNLLVYVVLGGTSLVYFMHNASTVDYAPGRPVPVPGIVGVVLLCFYVLAAFIPAVAVQVRRFHDQDKSGWFILLGLIPYAGALILLIFMLLEGTRGPNRFGADPRDPYNIDVFG